jgi:hypothetical protein
MEKGISFLHEQKMHQTDVYLRELYVPFYSRVLFVCAPVLAFSSSTVTRHISVRII